MLKNNKIKGLFLALLLTIVSSIVILLSGKTYTYKTYIVEDYNLEDIVINVEQDNEIIKIIDKKIENGYLIIKIESVNEGKGYLDVEYNDLNSLEVFYVHKFGIITQNNFLGKSSCDIVVPISLLIFIGFVLFTMIKKYKNSIKENIYQYRNIAYLGIIIFLTFLLLDQCLELIHYNGLYYLINGILGSVNFISVILLPIAIIVSVFVVISNVVLLKREGFTWKNMLGIILGLLLIVATILPNILYNYLGYNIGIDIHNEGSIVTYIYNFIETFIYIGITYLECVLLGTIIIGIKASRHIPKYNKDYIIILGCMIKKDGTLTPLLKSRVDRAIEFAKLQKENSNKDIVFIPSGGKGNDEIISEAEAIKNYLIEQGIDSKKIIIEDKSTNTYENIRNSYKLIHNKKANIAFSTTNYHVFRAGLIASSQNILTEGIGSKTRTYFWINAFIREFIATLYSERRKHLKMICIVMLITMIMILLTYISNIL